MVENCLESNGGLAACLMEPSPAGFGAWSGLGC